MTRKTSLSTEAAEVSKTAKIPVVKVPKDAVRVPCCQCIGGKGQLIRIRSGSGPGSVPLQVSGPGVINAVAQTITSNVNSYWNANLSPAQWVQPDNNNGATNHQAGTFNYTVQIYVPHCVIPMDVRITGRAAGDDQVTVYRGSSMIGQTPLVADPSVNALATQGGWGFRAARILTLTDTLPGPGLHTLSFEVVNGSRSPHGLMFAADIRTTCSKNLEYPPGELEDAPHLPDGDGISLP